MVYRKTLRKGVKLRIARKGTKVPWYKQPKTMTTLAKRINRLQRKVDGEKEVHYCYHQVSALALTNDYSSINVTNYNKLLNASSDGGPLFGSSSPDFDAVNKVLHHSTTIQYTIDIANEMDNVQLTIMLLSLKQEGRALYDPATSAAPLYITDGPHFRKVGGMTMVNKKLFNIHYIKNLNIGNNNQAVTAPTADNGLLRIYSDSIKIKPRCTVTNPGVLGGTGDIDVLYADPKATQQYYLVIFNNNSGIDAQSPTITMNQITRFETF